MSDITDTMKEQREPRALWFLLALLSLTMLVAFFCFVYGSHIACANAGGVVGGSKLSPVCMQINVTGVCEFEGNYYVRNTAANVSGVNISW